MRILYVTTISLTMNTFFKPHVEMLVKEGHEVDIACNFRDMDLHELDSNLGCKIYQIDFSRVPISLGNMRSFAQLNNVVKNGNYDIVHCHTPNASVITRLVCRKLRRKNNLKVFYTAHGFHFYKGAPMLNWLVFYPIELFCSRFTDKLITINKEDFELAKRKFKVKEIYYVPGVGIDLSKFRNIEINRVKKRCEIGVPENAFLIFSVGELNENKNHQVVIRAMAKLKDSNLHYAIAGVGDKREYLLELASDLGVLEQLHMLGYRKDVAELYKASDLFCFPSFREGLSASLMEAMASGLPCIVSYIRGNTDLINENGGRLFVPHDENALVAGLREVFAADTKNMGDQNRIMVEKFSLDTIKKQMLKIYMGES